MRKFISLLLTVLFLLFSQAPVNAAVKAGSACKNIGETAESSGKVFTCNKSGKKLVWSKGVDIDLGWYAWNFRINSKGVLERKDSDFGKWNSLPTRSGQVIDPIRLKAFNEIQKYSTKTIPNG
jgi:hypothetical protein